MPYRHDFDGEWWARRDSNLGTSYEAPARKTEYCLSCIDLPAVNLMGGLPLVLAALVGKGTPCAIRVQHAITFRS